MKDQKTGKNPYATMQGARLTRPTPRRIRPNQ